MKPVDKFGRELYPRLFSTLKAAGSRLEAMGYEHHNLFSRQTSHIPFNADMWGTKDVPIWKVPVALVFTHLPRNAIDPIEEFEARARLIEVLRLGDIDLRTKME